MSTATNPPRRTTTLPLVEGQRLDQPTFHARYEAMPPGTRAELVNGVVSMPSPVGSDHARSVVPLVVWLDRYAENTPGVEVLDNATVILGWRNEPQPDLTLRVLPDRGGQTRDEAGYVAGPPEMVVEISRSTRYVDLGPKFEEYERAGIQEYVVHAGDPDEVLWHVLNGGRFVAVAPGEDGLYHSRVFPGLWLDPVALLAGDRAAVRGALDRGLASPEHAEFVARLAAGRGGP